MSNNSFISVVMPVYNGEKYLYDAIDSILNQTYKEFEFIIINDGSTDNSLDIINDYAKEDSRIEIITRENRGLISSLNEGIKSAKGKYIVRMDADDISLSSRIEEQVRFMDNHPDIGISGTAVLSLTENRKETIWRLATNDKTIRTELLFSSPFAHPSVIMRKDLIFKYQLFYNKQFLHAEDYALWTEMAKYTKFANLKTPLLKYRVLESSITREADKNYEQRYRTIKKIFENYLLELGVENSDKENRLHFDLSVNNRIKDANIEFEILKKYFEKLLTTNSKKNFFNHSEFKKVLGKKWLWNLYYKREIKAIFSKYFFYGVWGMVTK